MKIVFVVMVVLALLVPAVSGATAPADVDQHINVSLGTFYLSATSAKEVLGGGIGLALDRQLRTLGDYDIHANIGYVNFSNTVVGINVKESLVPITIRAIRKFGDKAGTNHSYAGVGLGLVVNTLKAFGQSNTETDPCIELIGGMKFGDKMFAELKWLRGGKDANTGIGLNVGSSF